MCKGDRLKDDQNTFLSHYSKWKKKEQLGEDNLNDLFTKHNRKYTPPKVKSCPFYGRSK